MTTWPKRRGREAGKLTWRCRNRLSLSSAWFAPLNRGSLNSAHIHGTDVPVEEPSTASVTDDEGRPIINNAGQPVNVAPARSERLANSGQTFAVSRQCDLKG